MLRYRMIYALVSVNLLAWSFDCYCLFSLLSFAPREALHSSSHLCALGAGMQHACLREEAVSSDCCRWPTPDSFRECRLDIITRSNQNALMIRSISRRATCVIRSLSPRDNNLISRTGDEAQYVQLIGLYLPPFLKVSGTPGKNCRSEAAKISATLRT